MPIGWIDFSKDERNKVLNVIHLLDEPGAVDELGIGAVRDTFAVRGKMILPPCGKEFFPHTVSRFFFTQ